MLQAVVDGGRRDPLRSWYAAVGVLMVVFMVVTSIGVIAGRSANGAYPIMVQPQGPALPVAPFDGASPFDPTAAPAGTSTSPSARPVGPGPRPVVPPDRDVTVDRHAAADTDREPDAGRGLRPGSPATHTTPHRPATPTSGATVPASRPDPTTEAPAPPQTTPPNTTPPRTTPPTTRPAGAVTARYIVYSSWQDGFTTGIELANTTGHTQPWKLKLIHQRSDGVRVKELWNADLKQGGATTNVFVGGDLAPGATLHFGFNASKTVERAVRPTSCTINGRSCSIS